MLNRFFDILLSSFGLVFLSPLLVIIYTFAFFDTGAPLFRQQRVGRYRLPFSLLKFRSMHKKTASVASHLVNPTAITQWGHFLRRSKLDELPQLWNVLKGEMSLVGPRPCLTTQHDLISAREKFGVFAVRPGITGLAQISGIDMSNPELLAQTDARMIAEMSTSNYLKYIFLTIVGKGSGNGAK